MQFLYDPAIPFLDTHSREMKTDIHKSLSRNAYISANSPKVETTQMFLNWRMNEQNAVYPVLLGLKEECSTHTCYSSRN